MLVFHVSKCFPVLTIGVIKNDDSCITLHVMKFYFRELLLRIKSSAF